MNLRTANRITTITVLVLSLLLIVGVFWGLRQLHATSQSAQSYYQAREKLSGGWRSTMNGYLYSGDATQLSAAQLQLTEILNKDFKTLPTDFQTKVAPDATQIAKSLETDLRDAGKLAANPEALLQHSEAEVGGVVTLLTEYASQQRDKHAEIALQYLSELNMVNRTLATLAIAREHYFEAHSDSTKQTLLDQVKELQSAAARLGSLPSLNILVQNNPDEFTLGEADNTPPEEKSTSLRQQILSTAARYAKDLENTDNTILLRESSRLKVRQEIQHLLQDVADYESLLSAEQADIQRRVQIALFILAVSVLAASIGSFALQKKLATADRKNLEMMKIIADQNAELECRVSERTAELAQKTNDIHTMLHNMQLGVCTIVHGNQIHPEFSNYMRTIFARDDIANAEVSDCIFNPSDLGPDVKNQIEVALDSMIGEGSLMFDLNGHLLPKEISITNKAGNKKILQLEWNPIINPSDDIDKVLLIVQDVTHLRELEQAAEHQKAELTLISQLIKVTPGKFNAFAESALSLIAQNGQIIEDSPTMDADAVAALFRNMHTIKGNARTFEFTGITDAAHCAEQEYDLLRRDPAHLLDRDKLLVDLKAVEAVVVKYVDVNDSKLGRKGRASDLITYRGVFVSDLDIVHLKNIATQIADQSGGPEADELLSTINKLGLIPLERIVSGTMDSLSSLAKELEKPTPEVEIVRSDISFNPRFAEALKVSLMHLVRNSLDHGIESPAEREQIGKPHHGRLNIVSQRHDGWIELRISDDGRGLALHRLREKGIEQGLISVDQEASNQDIANLMFHPGLSTAASVTQISGRGVGMDAVRQFLEEQNAQIVVALTDREAAESGHIPFEFVIRAPEAICQIG